MNGPGPSRRSDTVTAMYNGPFSTTVSDDVDFLGGGPYDGTTQTIAARPGAPDELPEFLFWWSDEETPEWEKDGVRRSAEEVARARPHYRRAGLSPTTGRPQYVWSAPTDS